jgi:hypothetical protein
MTTTYGKLFYCALYHGFLGCRPFLLRRRIHAPSSTTHRPQSRPCTSLVAPRPRSHSKTRRVRRCSPTALIQIAGKASGRSSRTRITCAAPRMMAQWNGIVSRMTTSRRTSARPACSRFAPPHGRMRASTSSLRNHPRAGACWSAAPDGHTGERDALRCWVRGAARAAPCAARPHGETLRTTSRSSRRVADPHRRHPAPA